MGTRPRRQTRLLSRPLVILPFLTSPRLLVRHLERPADIHRKAQGHLPSVLLVFLPCWRKRARLFLRKTTLV